MSPPPLIPNLPLTLLLADWGQPAQLRETVSYYDPESGQLEQSDTETALVVIPGPGTHHRDPRTAVIDHTATSTFLVETAQLPAEVRPDTSQLAVANCLYTITKLESSPLSGLTLLHCN